MPSTAAPGLSQSEDGTWGYACTEHGIYRTGLAERHALNLEAKHLRLDHADRGDALDLTAAASELALMSLDEWRGALTTWRALTGLDGPELEDFLEKVLAGHPPVRAAVVPF